MKHRIIVIGLGSAGARHLRLARETLPGATIMVLRKNTDRAVPDIADGALASLKDVIDFEPTIGIISSPATAHVEALGVLLPLGTHLLIEKPLAASAAEVQALLDEANEPGGTCLVGYNLRFTESLRVFREMLVEGAIGTPLAVRCEVGQWLPNWRPNSDYRTTVTARSSLGGGVLLELSHEFDYLGWLFGSPEWVVAHTSKQSSLEIDVEDSAHILFGCNLVSESLVLVGTLSMDLLRRDKTRCCSVIGEEGTLRWDGVRGSVELYKTESSGWQTLLNRPNDVAASYPAQWDHFLDCIDARATPLVTLQDAYRTLEVVDACRESSREDRKAHVVANSQLGCREP